MAQRVSKDNFSEEVLSEEKLVIADFYSDSCIPCKRMSPVIAELEEELTDVKFGKLNINFDSETAEKYGVSSVPTLIFFRSGEEVLRLQGAQKKSQLLEAINNIK